MSEAAGRNRFSLLITLVCIVGLIGCSNLYASELEAQRDGLVEEVTIITPDFDPGATGNIFWQKEIKKLGATYLRLHIANVDIPPEREILLELRSRNGRQIRQYDHTELASIDSFWTAVIPGDYVLLTLYSDESPVDLRIQIDKIAYQADAGAPLSSYGLDERQPISDYQNDPIITLVQRAVARLLFMKNGVPSVCTGFLMSSDRLMTNHHCISEKTVCESLVAIFGYQYDENGLLNFGEQFECDSIDASDVDFELDFAVLQLKGKPGIKWGKLDVVSADPAVDDKLFIIQHPSGLPKQISKKECNLMSVPVDGRGCETDFAHTCDTLGGSSGSPVFDQAGRVIGLHHYGFGEEGEWTENRAVRMVKILPKILSE